MANKTLRFYGNGYAPTGTSASVSVTFNGTTVFEGAIPTLSSTAIDTNPDNQVILFTFEVDEALYGTYPMSIQVTGGDLVATSYAESSGAEDPIGTPNPSLYYTLCQSAENQFTDYRTNVEIDGVAQSKGSLGDILTGAWQWEVPNGSTLTSDVTIVPWIDIFHTPPPAPGL